MLVTQKWRILLLNQIYLVGPDGGDTGNTMFLPKSNKVIHWDADSEDVIRNISTSACHYNFQENETNLLT